MKPLKSLQSIQEPLEVGLKVVAALELAVFAITPFVYAGYSRLPRNTKLIDATASTDDLLALLGLLEGLAAVGVLVMFFMWVYRATKNLRALTSYPVRQSPGWSVGWYFVPIAFLFKPYEGMTDIWNASGANGGKSVRLTWWLIILGSTFIGNGISGDPWNATVVHALRYMASDMFTSASNLAVALATLVLVSRVGAAYSNNVSEWSIESPAVPAGWYDDPSGAPARRYWDGSQWTDRLESAEVGGSPSV